jgi:hypothetical protein
LDGIYVVTASVLCALTLFSLSAILLRGALGDADETADLRLLIGTTLLVLSAFISSFTIKRFLAMRKVSRHARGRRK